MSDLINKKLICIIFFLVNLQGIWAGSTDIGCGIAFCPTLENNYGEDMTNANFIVCNYGPG